MTDQITQATLSLPAGNGSQAIFFNHVDLGLSDVEYITLVFPPGCAGLVGVRIEFAVNPVYPLPTGSWFIFDDYTFNIQVSGQGNSGQWRVVGYNQDTYPHNIQSYWGWNYLKRPDASLSSPLISL